MTNVCMCISCPAHLLVGIEMLARTVDLEVTALWQEEG